MLVTVVEMRLAGQKLPQEELAAAAGHTGHLTVADGNAYLHSDPNHEVMTLGCLVPPLYACMLTKMRDGGFVLVGTNYKDGTAVKETNPQAWWCRLAPVPAVPSGG